MHEPLPRDDVQRVIDSGLPLGVQCLYCYRRALIQKERLASLTEKSSTSSPSSVPAAAAT